VKWQDDTPSAQHHLQEFLIIEPHLKPGALVMIDDNSHVMGRRAGKGRMIYQYLVDKDHLPIYDAYQIIYEF
jgi:hypothetical protein